MSFCCCFCAFRCGKWRVFLRHTFESHSSLPNFSFNCPVDGCNQTFQTFSAISSHLSRKHPTHDLDLTHSLTRTDPADIGVDNLSSTEHYEDNHSFIQQENNICRDMDHKIMVQRSAALFLLTLKERYSVTQTALDFAIQQIKGMVGYLVEDMKANLKERFENCPGEVALPDITECFNCTDPFANLGTEYLQYKFYQEHFGLVVRHRIIIV